jgi:hypothetical protein
MQRRGLHEWARVAHVRLVDKKSGQLLSNQQLEAIWTSLLDYAKTCSAAPTDEENEDYWVSFQNAYPFSMRRPKYSFSLLPLLAFCLTISLLLELWE